MLKIASHPVYVLPLPEGHRFPMAKYDLLPKQLLHEGTCTVDNFFRPVAASDEDITRAHSPNYLEKLKTLDLQPREIRKTGFPLSEALVEREILIAGGTIKGSEYALQHGIAMNIAGGTHHAYTSHGEAFCLLNDQAIAARYLQHHKLAKKILIIDLDVHQGNGTAEIFSGDNTVFTFSMHGKNNYPFKKENSDLDIELPDHTTDAEYLETLQKILPKLLFEQKPDFVFYLCGVDVLASDKLGKLGLTIEGCKQRDEIVLELLYRNQIPVQCSMGGGYSPNISLIIEAHANIYRTAQHLYF